MELQNCLHLSPDQIVGSTIPLNPLPLNCLIVPVTAKAPETRDWASLPSDLLVVVAGRLTCLADFSSFRRVCSSWRSNVIPSAHTLSSQSPLIMLHVQNREFRSFDEKEKEKYLDRLSFDVVFLDLRIGRFYKPESSSSWRSFNLLNFSHGYIAKAFGNGRILLCHLFTNDKIWLPKTRTPFDDKKNIIFSGNPSSPQCLFALYTHDKSTLEFCQQGDTSWKTHILDKGHIVVDLVFFQGKIYALLRTYSCFNASQLAVIEFNPSFTLKLLGVPVNFNRVPFFFTSGDELILYSPCEFFIWDFGCSGWVLKSSLDGKAVFISPYQVTACINPNQDSWIKPNYQYLYSMNRHELTYGLRVEPWFGGGSQKFFEYLKNEGIQSQHVGRPVWIFPSMCFSIEA